MNTSANSLDLCVVAIALAEGVKQDTWDTIGTYVRTTFPLEIQWAFLRELTNRLEHDDCLGIRKTKEIVEHSMLYRDWLDDKPLRQALLGG
jgi:hypothetical protein